MAKTPKKSAPEETTNVVTLTTNAGAVEDLRDVKITELEARVADLEAERAKQHEIITDLHARLAAVPAPPPPEEVVVARNVRKYGE